MKGAHIYTRTNTSRPEIFIFTSPCGEGWLNKLYVLIDADDGSPLSECISSCISLRLSIVQSRAQDCLTPRLVAPMKLNEVVYNATLAYRLFVAAVHMYQTYDPTS